MPLKKYENLTTRTQVSRMRAVAIKALKQYKIKVTDLRLVNHGYNTTFRVTQPDRNRFALRINVNSHRTLGEMNAETAWVEALSKNTDLWVPTPIKNELDHLVTTIQSDTDNRSYHSVMYSWLEGEDQKNTMPIAASQAMGLATKELHRHASTWRVPTNCELSTFDDVLIGQPVRFEQKGVDTSVFYEVMNLGNKIVRRLRKTPVIPIHYDVHWNNIKFVNGRLAIFDFDDCRYGWPCIDPSVTMVYTRRRKIPEKLEEGYWCGYGGGPEELGISLREYETLIACRMLMLSNELFSINTANLISDAMRYAHITEKRLRHFLDTGIYDPNVAIA